MLFNVNHLANYGVKNYPIMAFLLGRAQCTREIFVSPSWRSLSEYKNLSSVGFRGSNLSILLKQTNQKVLYYHMISKGTLRVQGMYL